MSQKFAGYKFSCTFATAIENETIGRLAQLVQSICLTSRGSAVRIRQRPLNEFLVNHCFFFLGRLAQLVQSICLTSRGSAVRIRQRPLNEFLVNHCFFFLGRLAQLVQSICLTSRGSAVRIRQRPLRISRKSLLFLFGAFSSAGSEHLPYKQRVGGSNPSTPTSSFAMLRGFLFFNPFVYANIDSGR